MKEEEITREGAQKHLSAESFFEQKSSRKNIDSKHKDASAHLPSIILLKWG